MLSDIVALNPMLGVAGVIGASVAQLLLPSAAPVLQSAVWAWVGVLLLGLLRQTRLVRLRWPLWLRLEGRLRRSRAAR